ncbi:c-type cytochrome biogenesis protein CcsB [Actinomadura sp. 6N118]|uniref:c-type cytochrome biogenesis protein CcsB n=1 Tax=Actinomadura sp. 6N118 TaxID=3375151 RepID=UPI00379C8976
MPPDASLASFSEHLMTATIVVYTLAVVGYVAAFAARRPATATAVRSPAARSKVLVGAGGPPVASVADDGETESGPGEPTSLLASPAARLLARGAVLLTLIGWLLHLGQMSGRGLAAERLPWGTMGEFVTALVFAAVTGLLVLIRRQQVRYLGLFVMIPSVLGLGLSTTVLHVPVGPLSPSLHSYWLAIHVTAAVVASAGFTLSAAANLLYLIRVRHEAGRQNALAIRLPSAPALERLARQMTVFAFPMWTFAVIAGAIWADQAWGRYWGWDPKETWAFITWIVYAAHLHAGSTIGWRGRPAAAVALAGYGCLLFNLVGVNLWLSGMHSYAGI